MYINCITWTTLHHITLRLSCSLFCFQIASTVTCSLGVLHNTATQIAPSVVQAVSSNAGILDTHVQVNRQIFTYFALKIFENGCDLPTNFLSFTIGLSHKVARVAHPRGFFTLIPGVLHSTFVNVINIAVREVSFAFVCLPVRRRQIREQI